MHRTLVALLVTAVALTFLGPLSAVADDLRVRQLEIEVARLQRELAAQSRRIEELERVNRATGDVWPGARAPRPGDSSPAWLVAGNWDRIKPGMKEADVIALLGRPTSVRAEADGTIRVLLYALEIGPAAVLAGNVRMDATGVTDIAKPALR